MNAESTLYILCLFMKKNLKSISNFNFLKKVSIQVFCWKQLGICTELRQLNFFRAFLILNLSIYKEANHNHFC